MLTGRRGMGMGFAAAGLTILASEYPEKFEAVWENAPDYLQKGMQIFGTLAEAGRRLRRRSRAPRRQHLARHARAVRRLATLPRVPTATGKTWITAEALRPRDNESSDLSSLSVLRGDSALV